MTRRRTGRDSGGARGGGRPNESSTGRRGTRRGPVTHVQSILTQPLDLGVLVGTGGQELIQNGCACVWGGAEDEDMKPNRSLSGEETTEQDPTDHRN